MDLVFNLLSVDWDYFMKVPDGIQNILPDGNTEFSQELEHIIWSNIYAKNEKRLLELGLQEDELKLLYDMLENVGDMSFISIQESHKHIVQHINKFIEPCEDDDDGIAIKFNIYNIDDHHDGFGLGNTLNCGNWLNHLIEADQVASYHWVRNKNSTPLPEQLKESIPCFEYNSISEVTEKNFRLLFVCHSGMWSLPHLDNEYLKLIDTIGDKHDIETPSQYFDGRWKIIQEGKDDLQEQHIELYKMMDSI